MPRRALFIGLFLAVQVALPLRYYLGHDRYDERFAWRMFSDVRMVRCRVEARADGRPVRLGRRFHMAWITLAERGRRQVLDAMAKRLCHDLGDPVTLAVTCRLPEGTTDTLYDGSTDQCRGGSP